MMRALVFWPIELVINCVCGLHWRRYLARVYSRIGSCMIAFPKYRRKSCAVCVLGEVYFASHRYLDTIPCTYILESCSSHVSKTSGRFMCDLNFAVKFILDESCPKLFSRIISPAFRFSAAIRINLRITSRQIPTDIAEARSEPGKSN